MEQTVFSETSTQNSDVGELPKGKNTAFTTRRRFEMKSFLLASGRHTFCNYQRVEQFIVHLDFSPGSHIFCCCEK